MSQFVSQNILSIVFVVLVDALVVNNTFIYARSNALFFRKGAVN